MSEESNKNMSIKNITRFNGFMYLYHTKIKHLFTTRI